jgi:DNA-binding MarR family transcriptional regulator
MVHIRRSQSRRVFGRVLERELGRPLHLSHAFVVDALEEAGEHPGDEPTVGILAARLGVDPSRASRMVAGAIQAGYVRRAASQHDGRRICLELTDSGREYAQVARRSRTAVFTRLVEGWPDRDCAALARLLTRFVGPLGALAEGLEDAPPETEGRRGTRRR